MDFSKMEQLAIDTPGTLSNEEVQAAKSGLPGTSVALSPLDLAMCCQRQHNVSLFGGREFQSNIRCRRRDSPWSIECWCGSDAVPARYLLQVKDRA